MRKHESPTLENQNRSANYEVKMNRPNVAANAFRMSLGAMAEWLFGCSHRRTTFPITLRNSVSVDGQRITQAETYIVCVQCGRHFAYDWTTMRTIEQRPVWAGGDEVQTLLA